jgi:hypothetical protein
MNFLVTCAYNIPNLNNNLSIIRNNEYKRSLDKIFSYNKPVYGIFSEMNKVNFETPSFLNYDYKNVNFIENTYDKYRAISKSQKEFCSIYDSLHLLKDIPDNDWIIKLTGRYLLTNDNFIEDVEKQDNNIIAVIKPCDNYTQCYTFCYAIRKKYFIDFFSNFNIFYEIQNKNIEMVFYNFLMDKYKDNTYFINNLNIYADIANCSNYQLY